MIYTCLNKGCHFLFYAPEHQTVCPDCGKPLIRPATRAEHAEYFRCQTQLRTTACSAVFSAPQKLG